MIKDVLAAARKLYQVTWLVVLLHSVGWLPRATCRLLVQPRISTNDDWIRSLILSRESMALPISAFSPIRFHSRPPSYFSFLAFRSNRFVGPHRVLGQLLFSSAFHVADGLESEGNRQDGRNSPAISKCVL